MSETMRQLICGDCGAVLTQYEAGNRAEAEQEDAVIYHQCAAQDRANRRNKSTHTAR